MSHESDVWTNKQCALRPYAAVLPESLGALPSFTYGQQLQIDELNANAAEMERSLQQKEQELSKIRAQLTDEQEKLLELELGHINDARRYLSSSCWKLSAPFRAIVNGLKSGTAAATPEIRTYEDAQKLVREIECSSSWQLTGWLRAAKQLTAFIVEQLKGTPVSTRPIGLNYDVALFPWGDLFEDFIDTIGGSMDTYCCDMSGGWLFGYIKALQTAGLKTAIIVVTSRVSEPTYRTHEHTGAPVCFLPSPPLHKICRKLMGRPWHWDVASLFADQRGLRKGFSQLLFHVAPYLAVPIQTLISELKEANCRVILCQEYETPRFDICVVLAKFLRLPVFASFQGGAKQLTALERFFRASTMAGCNGLIVASKPEIERVKDAYKMTAPKMAFIENPVDLSMWYPMDRSECRRQLGLASDAEIVFWHGRIDIHRKGLDILLSAWLEICRRRPDRNLRLILVGSGSDNEIFKSMISKLPVGNVQWIGEYATDRAKMRAYLSAADVYVLPSRHEGFAVAPLEAMACALPVVLSEVNGVRELLEDGHVKFGSIAPVNNAFKLAELTGALLDDADERIKMGALARVRIEQKYSVDQVGKELSDFFYARSNIRVSS